jgi:hypothetical protein
MARLNKAIATVMLAGATLPAVFSPAGAITAELAKKCRDMAVRAPPPQPAGTNPYAAAERSYFRECVSKGGNMDEKKSATGPTTVATMNDGSHRNQQPIEETHQSGSGSNK